MLLRFIYNLFLTLVAPFFLYGLYKRKANKPTFGKRWKEHFGFSPNLSNPKQPIWVHAVSVGEVVAISPLIKRLKSLQPNLNIVLTTTTSTGANEAKKLNNIVEHRYMPLDFPFAVKAFINKIKPKALFIMETELWPNTLHYCQINNIPVTVVNARLSARSAKRYKKLPAVFNLLFKNISYILTQTERDKNNFVKLGVQANKIEVTGSIKFDIQVKTEQIQQASELRKSLGSQRPVWIAASTHHGEDEQLLTAHKQLLEKIPNALLILVPRHPERFTSVQQLVSDNQLNVISRSSQQTVSEETQVYLGDSMGEMMILLGAADICFIAGSLIGDKVGGHNLLEAAALAKPILNGPSYFNFKEITEQLTELGACQICANSNEITLSLLALFNNKEIAEQRGQLALQFVKDNQGALQNTAEKIVATVS